MKPYWVDLSYIPLKALFLFWTKVDKNGAPPEHNKALGNCWDWKGQILPGGYAVFRFSIGPYSYRQPLAHKMSYEMAKGDVPDDMVLDHLCRNRSCVNPDHLEPVTIAENLRRGKSFAGVNYRKTVCPKGHKLEGDNLDQYKLKIGKRSCRICTNILKKERRWRQKRNANRNNQTD